MIPLPRFAARISFSKRGSCAWAVVLFAASAFPLSAVAQQSQSAAHWLQKANEPPGLLGLKRRIAGGDVGSDYFQAVRFVLPGAAAARPAESCQETPLGQSVYGLQVGHPYRFVITNIPSIEDLALYPSIELIDRTYPPPGMETRFAIPIEFTREDLHEAAAGNYVERVVYVEDPELALPIATLRNEGQRVMDVYDDEDPLLVARSLGRPVAVVRLGSKAPFIYSDLNQQRRIGTVVLVSIHAFIH